MGQTVLIIFNLFILESLLSIDNAAVLSIMVKDLPARDRGHALKYGILGSFVMRGASLFAVSIIIKILWLKIAGGLYLLYLVYGHFSTKVETVEEPGNAKDSKIYKFGGRLGLNRLWATILLVEIMDMAFSIDNIFASVAMTSNIVLILIGVFVGIIAMRFVAQWFSSLIIRFPSLEKSAFIVIALLGLKLILTGVLDYMPTPFFMKDFINSHTFDFSFSAAMMFIFFVPLLTRDKTPTHAI